MSISPTLNATHDPSLRSWLESANSQDTDFTIHNLPYCVFTRREKPAASTGSNGNGGNAEASASSPRSRRNSGILKYDPQHERRIGVAIGDQLLDMHAVVDYGLLPTLSFSPVFKHPDLNALMSLTATEWHQARQTIQQLLTSNAELQHQTNLTSLVLVAQAAVQYHMPINVGDYSDAYAGSKHAYNVGVMFRGEANAYQPNYFHMPVAYHGRASSIVISGTDIQRPAGQVEVKSDSGSRIEHLPARALDFELELACFIGGKCNELGEAMNIDECSNNIFGFTLLNDHSARDIQRWEYVPLGPFTAKNFASTVSPFVVTAEALLPFRTVHAVQDKQQLLPYLTPKRQELQSVYNIDLLVSLTTQKSRHSATQGQHAEQLVSRSNSQYLYYTFEQMLAHHTVTGCNMRVGDCIGSGTISTPDASGYGSMLELTWNGSKPLKIEATGEERKFLQDGDEVIMRGKAASKDTAVRVGFGECRAIILPNRHFSTMSK